MQKADCIILGAGIAGITAGIYLKRSNLSCLVLDKDAPGGKLNNIHRIDNYPGLAKISGPELAMNLFNQANELGVPFEYGAVTEVKRQGDGFLVLTDVDQYECLALIVATGIENKKLGVPGEEAFNGKGVSYCATCDGNFFKGQKVTVYGHKDHAVEDAIYLSSLASEVLFLAPSPLETTQAHRDELLSKGNIRLVEGAKLLECRGEGKLSSILYKTKEGQKEEETSALFQLFGEKSSSMFLSSLGAESRKGFLSVTPNMETSVPGLFAAGDILDKKLRQLVNAAGEASVAATSAIAYIHAKKRG